MIECAEASGEIGNSPISRLSREVVDDDEPISGAPLTAQPHPNDFNDFLLSRRSSSAGPPYCRALSDFKALGSIVF